MRLGVPSYKTLLLILLVMFTAQTVISVMMKFHRELPSVPTAMASQAIYSNAQAGNASCPAATNVSRAWHPPAQYEVNSLSSAINGTGIYGFIFNSSQGPLNTYNWCNMPHTNIQTYPRVSEEYTLEYVEVIHRHHKRTPCKCRGQRSSSIQQHARASSPAEHEPLRYVGFEYS